MKGIFKIDEITSTNPVAVGDEVNLETESGSAENCLITAILPRKNYINRQSPRNKHQQHIVAANIDASILIATLKEPRTSMGFIDRFLVVSEMYHVPALIIFNKLDLYKQKELDKLASLKNIYRSVGYRIIPTSATTGEGIGELMEALQNRVSLFSGHSGVGKSSLLNRILPDLAQKTQDVSGWSGKGVHTTTFAEMFDLPGGNGKIIDTPGMREFGLVNISRQELSHYFPEMKERLIYCRFNNCLHINEPGCAVKEAVINNEMPEERYASYISILDSIEEKEY